MNLPLLPLALGAGVVAALVLLREKGPTATPAGSSAAPAGSSSTPAGSPSGAPPPERPSTLRSSSRLHPRQAPPTRVPNLQTRMMQTSTLIPVGLAAGVALVLFALREKQVPAGTTPPGTTTPATSSSMGPQTAAKALPRAVVTPGPATAEALRRRALIQYYERQPPQPSRFGPLYPPPGT